MSGGVFSALDGVGLNLQAVFELDRLPGAMRSCLGASSGGLHGYRQLILIGNAGPALWAAVKAAGLAGSDPIDDFSLHAVHTWFAEQFGKAPRLTLYPGDAPLDLQGLGQLAGWHHPSPFKVGINQDWGSWFAYRVALLADTALPVTEARHSPSPCQGCAGKPCIMACPAAAMSDGDFDLERCIAYRRTPASRCAAGCVARIACPVGTQHRYDDEQIRHGYSNSLKMIERYRAAPHAGAARHQN
ncbi:MAG: hypothetical protein H6950_12905 [Zoogloeaceae bacterium]|nr:hypothetical protein [Rhodocyclaceae bacterium]MCP5233205.1 hypothetical protein [Zoogloeaceae bacterium]MCP5239358.1 hypothetical protein [Zoogloeaceae bacterium]MCP5254874.1 hypothetical protein [Zoogloeaceae bacterium]MCP5295583.1 hypothetical protein [Zoogloeaceae bacterium]